MKPKKGVPATSCASRSAAALPPSSMSPIGPWPTSAIAPKPSTNVSR
jgi:hypothetical protein